MPFAFSLFPDLDILPPIISSFISGQTRMKTVIAVIVGNAMFALMMWFYQSSTGVSGKAMVPVLILTVVAFSTGIFLGGFLAQGSSKPRQTFRARSRNTAAAEMLQEIR